jgi:hypothetical protein
VRAAAVTRAAAELLERVAGAGGRLLGVEREPVAGMHGVVVSARLRLVFDAGVVELAPDAAAGLAARALAPREASPLPVDAAEEDPWWTVLGEPLARVSLRADASLLVQFRADERSPKLFVLAREHGGVAVRAVV